jgi:hypothetical protein
MSRLLLQRRGTIRFPAHAQGIVKMAWFGDVHLKQRAVTEFLVGKKESVTNIQRRLKIYKETMLLIKSLLVVGLHELRVLRRAKRSSVTRFALTGQQEQAPWRCCYVLIN